MMSRQGSQMALALTLLGLLLYAGTAESRILRTQKERRFLLDDAAAAVEGGYYMSCGAAPLCGVLVLETGLGEGPYQSETPVLHGLWPQDRNYGSSACVRPKK